MKNKMINITNTELKLLKNIDKYANEKLIDFSTEKKYQVINFKKLCDKTPELSKSWISKLVNKLIHLKIINEIRDNYRKYIYISKLGKKYLEIAKK